MADESFVDYYEILQVSHNADAETISRVFRYLAKRYHPDNAQTGDRDVFDELITAHRILSDAERRAAFDARCENERVHASLGGQRGDGELDDDEVIRQRILSVLYSLRRRDIHEAALGEVRLELELGCPRELLAFQIWYLKQKQLVEQTDRGIAITIHGIDEVEASRTRSGRSRLLTEHAHGGEGDEASGNGSGRRPVS